MSSTLSRAPRTAALWVAGLLTPALLLAVTVEAPQGSVVRWSGESESCGMDGRTWKAYEGDCYYPVDFQRDPATIEIARWPAAGAMESAWLRIVEQDFGEDEINFPDDSFVTLSGEDLERHYGEQAEIKPIFRRRGERQYTLPLGAPADPLPDGRGFGERRIFNGESKNSHTGVDYAIGTGNPALSVADGTVALVGEHFFAGTSVYVDHGDGMVSMYFHLESIEVEVGQSVSKGDTVGKIGSTGRSTGPHLHLGLRWRGARIDPTPLIGTIDVVEVP